MLDSDFRVLCLVTYSCGPEYILMYTCQYMCLVFAVSYGQIFCVWNKECVCVGGGPNSSLYRCHSYHYARVCVSGGRGNGVEGWGVGVRGWVELGR